MAELHEALKTLSPIDYDDELDHNALPSFLTETFENAELLCNSVPPPAGGKTTPEAEPACSKPNTARSTKDMQVSEARSPALDPSHEALQKSWGKPYKFGQKENPLGIALYKMAGKDRNGAWFARRSVHEGMGFDKFKRAMQREFPESLAVQGGPGEGAIRGLTGDRRLERLDVEGGGKGRVEVYQLSAQFPGPVTPREFMTLLSTSENALTGKSEMDTAWGEKVVPRHFLIVSKPVKHHDAPERAGFLRGQYESVEMIREIPLNKEKPELNPVEWIMITRSDPGGGIPRFMVERGTPSAMIGDVHKFLDWAAAMEDVPDADADVDKQIETSDTTVETSEPAPTAETATEAAPAGIAQTNGVSTEQKAPVEGTTENSGMFSNVTNAIENGIQTYAPAAVSSYLPNNSTDNVNVSSSASSSSTSINSFMSAEEERRASAIGATANPTSTSNLSAASTTDAAASTSSPESSKTPTNTTTQAADNEKQVQKLQTKQQKLEEKLSKKREAEEAKLSQSKQKEESEQVKAREKYERELKKTEERHAREVAKLEQKKQKEAEKAAAKRRKHADRDALSKVSRERDDFREQVDLLKREMELVRLQLGAAQRENTALATRLGKLGGGGEALKGVRAELEAEGAEGARSRASSSVKSGKGAS
ncbi:hypothetical protein MBLNU230_g6563t1 [Neophaeotheca triangularis]